MWDKILDTFAELAPLWWTIAVVIVFFCVKFYYSRFKKTEDTVNNLPCSTDKDYLKKRDRAYEKIDETADSIATIKKWIAKLDPQMVDSLYSVAPKCSPRKLNWLGDEIIKLIDGINFLQKNKHYFFDLMDKEAPQTAYDVEQSAYSVCFLSIDKEIFYPIKDILYNASAIKVQDKLGKEFDFIVDIFNVCTVLSVPLREMYLEKHPDLLSNTKDSNP